MSYMDVIINFPLNDKHRKFVCRSLALQDEIFEEYIEILEEITEEAVIAGETHDAIVLLKDKAKEIFKATKDIDKDIKACSNDFHQRIDDIDLHLYGRDYD